MDPEAAQTRELIKEGGGYHTVLNLIWETEDERTRVYALGALRNLTTYPAYPAILHETGAVERLEELAASESQLEQTLASACLTNMRACEEAFRAQEEERRKEEEEKQRKEEEKKRREEALLDRVQPLQWQQAPDGQWWAQAPDGEWFAHEQWWDKRKDYLYPKERPNMRLNVGGLNGYTAMKETMKELGEPRARASVRGSAGVELDGGMPRPRGVTGRSARDGGVGGGHAHARAHACLAPPPVAHSPALRPVPPCIPPISHARHACARPRHICPQSRRLRFGRGRRGALHAKCQQAACRRDAAAHTSGGHRSRERPVQRV